MKSMHPKLNTGFDRNESAGILGCVDNSFLQILYDPYVPSPRFIRGVVHGIYWMTRTNRVT